MARVLVSPADVRRADRRRNRLQPDVFVIRLRDGRRPDSPCALTDLSLAIEVESPGNPGLDYQIKRPLYVGAGVEYWIASPTARVISRWTRAADAGDVRSDRITWQPSRETTPLTIDIQQLYDEALR